MAEILFLSQLLPFPPDAGAKVRSYYVLRWLAQNHNVTLLTFYRPDDNEDAIQHLKQLCKRVVTVPMQRSFLHDSISLLSSIYQNESFIIKRDVVKEMKEALNQELIYKEYDAVHTDQLWMACYALQAKQLQPNIKLVLDEHNACFLIFERLSMREKNPVKKWLWEREANLLHKYEAMVCSAFNQIVTVSDEDRHLLQDDTDRGNWITIPICVDASDDQVIEKVTVSLNVVHMGTMFWPPNVEGIEWFGSEVWPLVVKRLKDATLTIVGKNPPDSVRRMERSQGNIIVTGYVSDPKPYLEKAAVFIVPLLSGGGMRVKILDAWRWGLPVVSTRIGAEGISYKDGENILIADMAEEFAEAVIRVMTNPDLSQRLMKNGRAWVSDHYHWRKEYHAWDEVYPVE